MSPTQLPKKGGSASRRDASSSSANLIARLRGRVFLFVFLVGEGKKPVSQWRGALLSQKLRRLSKWFPGLWGCSRCLLQLWLLAAMQPLVQLFRL